MAFTVRELFAKLGLDIDKASFTAGDVAIAATKAGLVAIVGAATIATTALGSMVETLTQTAGKLQSTAQAAGIGVETLQELTFAAKLSGAGMEDVATSATFLARRLIDASKGEEQAVKTFAEAGIKIRNASGEVKNADEVFQDLARIFKTLPDGPKKTALAVDVLGKSGTALIPVLNAGAENLALLRQEARELGVVIDKETIEAADALGSTIDKLKMGVAGLRLFVGGLVLKEIKPLIEQLLVWFKANKQLINQRLETAVKATITGLKALAGVLKVVYTVLATVIKFWEILAVVLGSTILAILIQNIVAIGALAAKWLFLGELALVSGLKAAAAWALSALPVILLTGLIAVLILLVDEWITNMEGGDTLLGVLWPKWKNFLKDFAGKPEEPFWISFLRFGISLIEDFGSTMQQVLSGWFLLFMDFQQWFNEIIENAAAFVINKLGGALDGIKSFFNISDSGGTIVTGASSTPVGAAGLAPGGQRNVSLSSQNNVNIVQREGESSSDLASRTRQMLDERERTKLDETLAALGG